MPESARVAEIADIRHSSPDDDICDRPQSLFGVDTLFWCKEYISFDPLSHSPCFWVKKRFKSGKNGFGKGPARCDTMEFRRMYPIEIYFLQGNVKLEYEII